VQSRALEAEGQKLRSACGVAIHQRAETDLVGDAKAGEAFNNDAGHDPEHGGAAVKELNPLELFQMNHVLGAVLEPLIGVGGVAHGAT